MSWKLAKRNPEVWLHNAWTDFLFTFDFHPWMPSGNGVTAVPGGNVVRYPDLLTVAVWIGRFQTPVLTSLYVLTLLAALLAPVALLRVTPESLAACTVMVFASATLATMAAYSLLAGYDQRYGVPHIAIMILCGSGGVELALRRSPKVRTHNSDHNSDLHEN